ncbi:AMP-binding protein [Actinomadura kijaniata]|uniref:AMP-binding protein n=1 Tax=Actinomadura kijaniata TaxID=46161 RepID=UPI00082A6E88|nr:AMP-binding protein [Actinomadura kijaniata]
MFEGEHARPVPSESTVTRSVIDAAWGNVARGGDRPALVDPGQHLGLARFASLVPAAAAGLRRHGLRCGDVAAIHLGGVCDLALAVHAVTAAGAVPAPLPRAATVGELAAMMIESGARFLFTDGDTAAASLAATERSYVRQVFAFGDVPDATPFARLVDSGTAGGPVTAPAGPAAVPGRPPSPHATPTESARGPERVPAGPGGTACDLAVDPLREPALRLCAPPEEITHAERLADLRRLRGVAALDAGGVLVCAADDCSTPTLVGLLDLCLTEGAILVGVPDPGTDALLEAIGRHRATHAVITPAKLRALTLLRDTAPAPGVRLLVTGSPDPEVVHTCESHHGWTVALL